jgi:hypothetical protein
LKFPAGSIVGLVCAGTLLFAACGGGDSKPSATATPTPIGALDALADWVRINRNVDFVGECTNAKPGVDVGKTCATLVGSRGTRRAYSIGPTFSEGTGLAILEQKPEGWAVLSVKNRDPSTAAVPGIDWPLQVGDQVVVIGLGEPDCLRIRDAATQEGKQLNCMPDGTTAIVQEGPIEAETFIWWRIAGDGFNGWAAGTWLRLPEAIAQALATPVPPTATP